MWPRSHKRKRATKRSVDRWTGPLLSSIATKLRTLQSPSVFSAMHPASGIMMNSTGMVILMSFKICIDCCCFPFCRLDACTGTGQVEHGPVFQTLLSIFMKSLTLVSARDRHTAPQPMCRSAYAHAGRVGDYFQHLKAKPAELSEEILILAGILNGEDIAFLQK